MNNFSFIMKKSISSPLLVIFATTTLLAIPFTTFQYLDLQYQTHHVHELQYVVRNEPMMTEYAYHPTPWNIPMKTSNAAFLLIPALTTLFVTFRFLSTSQGTPRKRLINSLFVASSFTPIFYFCNLPWGFFYWDGWEWPVSALLILFYGLFIIICAAIVNSISLRQGRLSATSS